MKPYIYSILRRTVLIVSLCVCGCINSPAQVTNDTKEPAMTMASFQPAHAGIGDIFSITFSNAPPDLVKKLSDTNKLSLLLSDTPFRNTCCNILMPANGTNTNTVKLQFELTFGTDNRNAWSQIIRRQRSHKQISVGVALADGTEYMCSGTTTLNLIVLDHSQRFLAGALLGLFTYLFLYLATQTEMIRDADPTLPPDLAAKAAKRPKSNRLKHNPWLVCCGAAVLVGALALVIWFDRQTTYYNKTTRMSELFTTAIGIAILAHYWFYWKPATATHEAKKLNPYSLARTQMAIWFFLIVCSWVFLWLVTGTLDTLTNTVLALMGIGAGTALGAEVQDAGKPRLTQVIQDKMKAIEKKQADKTILPSDLDELAALQKQLDIELAKPPPVTKGFFADVLTDANDGISFHRFQMLVWTVVLGIVFAADVYQHLIMPDFDGTMLALMGISSGTYLGFMIKENHSLPATA